MTQNKIAPTPQAIDLLSALLACIIAVPVLYWSTGLGGHGLLGSLVAAVLLLATGFWRRGWGVEFAGILTALSGVWLTIALWPVIASEAEVVGVGGVVFALVAGGIMTAWRVKNLSMTMVVAFFLFFGASSVIFKSSLGAGGITWIYEGYNSVRGKLVAAEACYVVENPSGILQLLPAGHLGVLPLSPSPEMAGQKIGPYRIVGILEMGGVVDGVGDSEFAQLEFRMIAPMGGGGVGVVKNPLKPAI